MKSKDIQLKPNDPGTTPISLSELALHNTPDDCWVAIHGDVYDLTNYAKRHPGGEEMITFLAGTDGTLEYETFHTESLLRSVQGNKIGPLMEDGESSSMNSGEGGSSSAFASNGGDSGGVVACSDNGDCISLEELARHNTADDCWIALHGNVYDLTEYANRHPGGAGIVRVLAGTDGTTEFEKFHSESYLLSIQGDMVGPFLNDGNTTSPGGGGSSPSSDGFA